MVYKKLMGCKPTLEDLEDCNPQLARGLKMLLEFEGDVEEVVLAVVMRAVSRALPQASAPPLRASHACLAEPRRCAIGRRLRGQWWSVTRNMAL